MVSLMSDCMFGVIRGEHLFRQVIFRVGGEGGIRTHEAG